MFKFEYIDNRTWVNKDKFKEFEDEYHDSQDGNSSINISDVEFEVHINMKDLDTKIIGIKKMDSAYRCSWRYQWRQNVCPT